LEYVSLVIDVEPKQSDQMHYVLSGHKQTQNSALDLFVNMENRCF